MAFPISAAFRIATRPIALAARLIVFVVTRTIALAIGLLSFTATSAVPRIVRLVAFVVTKPVVLIAGLVAFLATVAGPRIVGSLLSILGKQVSLVAGYLLFVADLIIYVMVRVQGEGETSGPRGVGLSPRVRRSTSSGVRTAAACTAAPSATFESSRSII